METNTNEYKRVNGKFVKGTCPGPGRTPDTPEQKLMKKAIKEIVKEYKESLADGLLDLAPIIKAKALEGDMTAIKEIHDRVMDKSKQPTDITTDGKELPAPIINIQRDAIHTDDSIR